MKRSGLRLDELGRKGYRILQDPDAFCFGVDAVLLADFAKAGPEERVLDLGTGNGIIPLLLDARDRGGKIVGLELQADAAALAQENFKLNHAEERLKAVCGDLKEASALFGRASFDVVVTNPPYQELGRGVVNPDEAKMIARHEAACTLEDVLREAAVCLKLHGRFYMVHRPKRLAEILSGMERVGIAPRTLRFVHAREGEQASLVLVSGFRGGGKELRVLPPLIIYGEGGGYRPDVYEIYYGDRKMPPAAETKVPETADPEAPAAPPAKLPGQEVRR